MLGIVNFGAFVTASVLLNLTPGADTIYVLSRSATGGRKTGIASALGISSGILIHTVLAAVGLSAILATSATAFSIMKLLGAGYLVVMGVRTLISKKSILAVEAQEAGSAWAVYRQGVLTNALNPKVALFFLALLPQYVSPGAAGPLPFLVLGLTFVATSTVWCLVLATAAGFVSRLLQKSEAASRWANRAAGCIYIVLGLNVLRARMAE